MCKKETKKRNGLEYIAVASLTFAGVNVCIYPKGADGGASLMMPVYEAVCDKNIDTALRAAWKDWDAERAQRIANKKK